MSGSGAEEGENAPLIAAPPGRTASLLSQQAYQPSSREKRTAYACFLVLGATVLLPWNLLIVVTPYFALRLRDSPRFSSSASSWVPLIFTAANLAFLLYSTYAQKRSGFRGIERKIFGCIGVTAAMIGLLLLSTSMRAVDPTGFFILLVTVSITGAGVSAVLQSGSAALASIFSDPFYLQGVMSGQGAIGFAVAVTQFLAALRGGSHGDDKADLSPSAGDDELLASTWIFFSVSLVFTVIAALATLALVRLPIYRRSLQNKSDIDDEPGHGSVSLVQVNRKVQGLGSALAFIYVVTIGLFPGITASIKSVNKDSALSSDLLWVPFGFVVFNTIDWLGRALPGFRAFVSTDKRTLIGASYLRAVFIPLLLLCNVQAQDASPKTAYIRSDIAYLLILACFALSNGWLTSLIMMTAVTAPDLPPEEVDVASTIMIVYLTAGLAIGAALNFALLSIVV